MIYNMNCKDIYYRDIVTNKNQRKVDEKRIKTFETRAGVCKTLCPQLPDSNTA